MQKCQNWKVEIINHQSIISLQVSFFDFLKKSSEHMLSFLSKREKYASTELLSTRFVEIALVDDLAIQKIHSHFLKDDNKTDVITFPYGEILISTETASKSAKEMNLPPESEIFLYLVHGLLHLFGYRDYKESEIKEMRKAERELISKCKKKINYPF